MGDTEDPLSTRRSRITISRNRRLWVATYANNYTDLPRTMDHLNHSTVATNNRRHRKGHMATLTLLHNNMAATMVYHLINHNMADLVCGNRTLLSTSTN